MILMGAGPGTPRNNVKAWDTRKIVMVIIRKGGL
jgi:hypothetical protein